VVLQIAGLIGLGYTDPGDGSAWQAPPTRDTERAPAPDLVSEDIGNDDETPAGFVD
jgi:hypothetical protein